MRCTAFNRVTQQQRDCLNRLILKENLNCALNYVRNRFRSVNPIPCFCFPETHGRPFPWRLLVRLATQLPLTLISRLACVLSSLTVSFSDNVIKHSVDFVEKVRNLPTLGKKLVLMWIPFSQNVPLDNVFDSLERKLSSPQISIPANCLIKLIRLYSTNNVFVMCINV